MGKREVFREEAKNQVENLLKNKSTDPLIANFQDVGDGEINHLKNILNGVQFNSSNIVFLTNVLVEELYLKVLPNHFDELFKTEPRISLKDLSGTK